MGTGEGTGDWEGELGGVPAWRRSTGPCGVPFGGGGGLSEEMCAEMPLSSTSLARPLG